MVGFHDIGDVEGPVFGTTCVTHRLVVDVARRGHQSQVPALFREHERCVTDLSARQQEVELWAESVRRQVVNLENNVFCCLY